jgi:ubiquinone/menaquinone biosynthesis C-methylase UbiE
MPEAWSKVQVADVYDAAASSYNRIGPSFFSYFGKRLVEAVEISPDARVLDVATGSGTALVSAAAATGPGGFVIGVDLAPRMARRASQEITSLALPNCAVLVGDAEVLPFADEQFDRVLCSFAIFLLPDLRALLAECRRVLRYGGRLGLAYPAGSDTTWEWYEQLLAEYEPAVSLGTERAPDVVEVLLGQAGFASISTMPDECCVRFADASEFWAWSWSHGARAVLDSLRGDRPAFKRRLFEELRSRAATHGLSYRVPAAITMGTRP